MPILKQSSGITISKEHEDRIKIGMDEICS